MTWLKGADLPVSPFSGCATDYDQKNIECALKTQKQLVLKKTFSRIVSRQNHQQSTGTGNNFVGLYGPSATNPLSLNNMEYYVTFYAKQLVFSNFAKNRENFKRELCLNVIIPFSVIVGCLVIAWCSKNVFWVDRNGGAQTAVRGGGTAPLCPPQQWHCI